MTVGTGSVVVIQKGQFTCGTRRRSTVFILGIDIAATHTWHHINQVKFDDTSNITPVIFTSQLTFLTFDFQIDARSQSHLIVANTVVTVLVLRLIKFPIIIGFAVCLDSTVISISFADIIGKPKNVDSPILVRDSLIFHLESGKQQQIILEAIGQDVVILKAKTIDSNTAFSANRPYLIYDSLIVAPNVTLTIPEGTTLCFHNRAYLGVYGKIVCNGSLEKPITFRGDRTDKIFPYLPYDRMDAQWGGITLYSSSGDNYFNYVDIHGGNWGIDCTTSLFVGTKFNIENSVIHNVKGFGLREYYIAGSVVNSQITNAGNDCVSLIGGYVDFVHCTIAQLYPWDGHHGVALHFANVQDSIIYPLEHAYFYNCAITGSTKDEIVGEQIENAQAAFNVNFLNCLVNIKLTGEEGEGIQQMFATSVNEVAPFHAKDSTKVKDDDIVWGKKNFKEINNEIYYYDFRLDSLSQARGIGNGDYVKYAPVDRLGKQRPTSKPDAGCYQYNEE